MERTVSQPGLQPVGRWLLVMWAMVWVMVGIGGITRLSGSGLSMVEWQPLMGALPPLSEAEWLDVFGRYKRSPQYLTVNHWMQLEDFKRIFFWEYLHRLFGRLIGVAFFVPLVYFVIRRQLRGSLLLRAVVALILGGAQGLLGWYMVMSGLVDEPRVSHLRLAAHLSLAFAVGAWLLWMALDTIAPRATRVRTEPGDARLLTFAALFSAGVGLQVVLGAFMAGTGAGHVSSTFPDLNGGYLPGPFFRFSGLADNLLYNPLAIHWTHRALAWALLLSGLWLAGLTIRRFAPGPIRRAAYGLALVLLLQFGLGVATVVLQVPIGLAVAHQITGYLLWSAAIRLCHRLAGRGVRPASTPAQAWAATTS